MKTINTTIFAALILMGTMFSCARGSVKPNMLTGSQAQTAAPDLEGFGREDNLAMGNPSNARSSSYYHWNYLITRPQYSLSYHRDRGTPNWVSWHMNEDWQGGTPRARGFYIDRSLPSGWYRVSSSDYTNSGFDRGHNIPSADRTLSRTDNNATFYMTNVIPQAPNSNQRAWASLENYCRKLVREGNELYIVMGSYGTGGSGSRGTKYTLANGRVTVPNRLWKVVLVLPEGQNDLRRVTTATRVIAIDMPNTNSVQSNWGAYRTTVDAIEARRRYDLFSRLPRSIQQVIEARIDNGPTS